MWGGGGSIHKARSAPARLSVAARLPGVWDDPGAFVPYWDRARRIRSARDSVLCSAWRYRATNLLAVVSNGEHVPVKAGVRLDTDAIMGRSPEALSARDVEEPGATLKWDRGVLELDVAARDYRLVLFE